MPQMGESIFEGTITKWLKKAGDTVQKDEPLFEISTDKVDAEIPSPVAGVSQRNQVPEGATVQINTVVAVIGGAGRKCQRQGALPVHEVAQPQSLPRNAGASHRRGISRMAGTDIVMPQMGESIFEGTITKWLKKVGDTVQKDEPLFEISTDKVDAEIPSPVAGILTEIKVRRRRNRRRSTPSSQSLAAAPPVRPTAPAARKSLGCHQQLIQPSPHSPTAHARRSAVDNGSRLRSSPLVRRIAKENNLDLQPGPRHRLRWPHHQRRHPPLPCSAQGASPHRRSAISPHRLCRSAEMP